VHENVVDLRAGDWILLPAHVRHWVIDVEPGTSWLALHVPAAPSA
jgi:quercetin dioxygenase-like cupin family protein